MPKARAAGMRKNPPIGLITGQYANVNTRFVYGSGVGALSTAVRRRQLRYAPVCTGYNSTGKCGYMLRLGMQPKDNGVAILW